MSSMYEPRGDNTEKPSLAMPQRSDHTPTSSAEPAFTAPAPPWVTPSHGTPHDPLAGARRLHTLAVGVLTLAAILGVCGVVAGIIVSLLKVGTDCGDFSCGSYSHPYVATGVSLIIGSIVQVLVVWLIAEIGKVVAENRWTLISKNKEGLRE